MLIKYLKMTVGYLIGEKDSEGQPRYKSPEVLRGNPKLSQRITDQITKGDRYTSFVFMDPCSWERFGGREAFEKFADMVERDLFVGMEKGEYNSLWVRHPRADGKTEVNFYCPNLHLPTGNKIKTYYSRADKGRLYDLMEIYSLERGLSSARDPRRKRAYKPINFTPKYKKQTAAEITDTLLKDIWAGNVHDRNDVIRHLEDRGFELARTKKVLSIKVEDGSNLRLRGWPYEQDFNAAERKKEIQEAYKDYCIRDEKKMRSLKWKYGRKLVKRRKRHRQRYPRSCGKLEAVKQERPLTLESYEKNTVGIFTQFIGRLARLFRKEQPSPEDPTDQGCRSLFTQGFPGVLRRLSFRRKVASTVRGGASKRRGWLLNIGASDTARQRGSRDPDQ